MRTPPTWFVPVASEPSWLSRPTSRLTVPSAGNNLEFTFPIADPAGIEELISHLEGAGAELAVRPLAEVMDSLARTADLLRGSRNPARTRMIELLAGATGRAESMIGHTLDVFLAKLSPAQLRETVAAAVGDPGALDGFVISRTGRKRRAMGPRLTFHVLAGNTPWAGAESLVGALLARSASLVKLSSAEPVFAGLFARTLAEIDPGLASAIAVLHWAGGESRIEAAILSRADAVVGFGDNDTVTDLFRRLAPRIAAGRVRFVPRGHRASVALIGGDALVDASRARDTASRLAEDFALEDQEGCLSPHAAYLIRPPAAPVPAVHPERFASLLAEALERLESEWPRKKPTAAASARIQQARATAELHGAKVFAPEGSTRWTVSLDSRARFELTPLNRYAVVRPVSGVETAIRALEPVCGMLSTVSIDGFSRDRERVLKLLAGLRPARICPIGEMQRPPAGWNHDGISDLAALLNWVECEEERE